MGDPKQVEASPAPPPQVTDDSGPIKVSYEIEQDEESTRDPSVTHKIKDKFHHLGDPGAPKQEQQRHENPPEPREQEQEATKLKVLRGEELGTGYEPDSDSSSIA